MWNLASLPGTIGIATSVRAQVDHIVSLLSEDIYREVTTATVDSSESSNCRIETCNDEVIDTMSDEEPTSGDTEVNDPDLLADQDSPDMTSAHVNQSRSSVLWRIRGNPSRKWVEILWIACCEPFTSRSERALSREGVM